MKIIKTSKGINLYGETTKTFLGINIGYNIDQYLGKIRYDKLYKKYYFKPYKPIFDIFTYELEDLEVINSILKELEDKKYNKQKVKK